MSSSDFEKTMQAHLSKNCCQQTWAVGRLRGTSLVQISLKKDINEFVNLISCYFRKTP